MKKGSPQAVLLILEVNFPSVQQRAIAPHDVLEVDGRQAPRHLKNDAKRTSAAVRCENECSISRKDFLRKSRSICVSKKVSHRR